LLAVKRDAAASNVAFTNLNVSGTALSTGGRVRMFGGNNSTVLEVNHNIGGSNNHAIRGFTNTGGAGLVGTSAASGGYGLYAEAGGIGPFTGAHPGLIRKGN